MQPFWRGAVTGALLATAGAGVALWVATLPTEPPPLIEMQLDRESYPPTPAYAAKLRAALAAAFPPGSKASTLRKALARSGFAVDEAKHSAKFAIHSLACDESFTVEWTQGPGDVLISVDGGFFRACL